MIMLLQGVNLIVANKILAEFTLQIENGLNAYYLSNISTACV